MTLIENPTAPKGGATLRQAITSVAGSHLRNFAGWEGEKKMVKGSEVVEIIPPTFRVVAAIAMTEVGNLKHHNGEGWPDPDGWWGDTVPDLPERWTVLATIVDNATIVVNEELPGLDELVPRKTEEEWMRDLVFRGLRK